MRLTQILFVCVLAVTAACGSKKEGEAGGSAAAAEVKWPDKPADGTPVVVEFVELVSNKGELEAKVRLFNFADKPVTRLSLVLDYLDGSGKKLKDFPWALSAAKVVDAKAVAEETVGAFIPAETKRVTARVRKVAFADDTEWGATR